MCELLVLYIYIYYSFWSKEPEKIWKIVIIIDVEFL